MEQTDNSGAARSHDFSDPGTLTFFFSDVVGSTPLLHALGDRYAGLLIDLRRCHRDALSRHHGREIDTAGDGFFAVFKRARDAVAAAAAIQRAILEHPWSGGVAVQVRIGLHTGEPTVADGTYVGMDVHRAARICSAAHGGQVLASQTTADLVLHELPDGARFIDLGTHMLKGMPAPERIFQLEISGIPGQFPPLGTRVERNVNFPPTLTSFVGRRNEVERLRKLIRTARIVTLTGPGGTGKTRLALEAAASLDGAFEDGAAFVGLAAITDPTLVATAIARVLELRESTERSAVETVMLYLQRRNMLLVLDNFEQILPAAPYVAELVAACPLVTVLATSREPLHLSGEQEFPVPPLQLPDSSTSWTPGELARRESVKLFLDRARAVRPNFELTPDTAPAVAAICRHLDGLPLAIELAAARVKILSPEAIRARLSHRFQLLTGGARDRPARHQTLWQTIAWSYDLLTSDEQVFFRRMSVFKGGCSLDAASYVCSACDTLDQSCSGCGSISLDALDAAASLVDRSLLRQEDSPDGEPRFLMLESIREYGLECLREAAEDASVRRAHAEYFLSLAEKAEPYLTGADQGLWLDRLEAEHDNLRAAFSWAEENREIEFGLRLGAALWRFWIVRGHMLEGRDRLETFLAMPGEVTRHRAAALNGLGTIIHEIGDFAAAQPLLEESLSMYRTLGDRQAVATVLNNMGWVTICLNDYATGRSLSQESLALCRELGDKRGAAVALMNIGWVDHLVGELHEARTKLEESLALRREIGDRRGGAFILTILGDVSRDRGDYEEAKSFLDEALLVLRELSDDQLTANALRYLGIVAHDLGDLEDAKRLLTESLTLWRGVGNRVGVAETLNVLGIVYCELGRSEPAGDLLNEALQIWSACGIGWGMAWALYGLSCVSYEEGDLERADSLFRESIDLFQKLGDKSGMASCFETMGGRHARRGDHLTATRLIGYATRVRESFGYAVPLRCRGGRDRVLEDALANLGPELFKKSWSSSQALSANQIMGDVNAALALEA